MFVSASVSLFGRRASIGRALQHYYIRYLMNCCIVQGKIGEAGLELEEGHLELRPCNKLRPELRIDIASQGFGISSFAPFDTSLLES